MRGASRAGTEYRIVVCGELDDRFGHLFEGLQLEREHGTTVLTGTIVDQAQLLGVIEQIQEFGLELLSVDRPGNATGGVNSEA